MFDPSTTFEVREDNPKGWLAHGLLVPMSISSEIDEEYIRLKKACDAKYEPNLILKHHLDSILCYYGYSTMKQLDAKSVVARIKYLREEEIIPDLNMDPNISESMPDHIDPDRDALPEDD